MLFAARYNFETILAKEIEPNFVRMKNSELKKYLQSVLRKNFAKNFWICP